MNLDLLIGELLMRNNCVVLPKFGGFIATQTEAVIDYSKGTISAPRKSILFNKLLTNNDGLLISAFAQKNQLSYDLANEKIDEQIKFWQEELNAGKRISLDKVGFLYLDNQKNILFEQDRFFNLLMQSFGMGQVQFVSEQKDEIKLKETLVEQVEIKQVETPIIQLLPIITKKQTEKFVQEDKPLIENGNVVSDDKKIIKLNKKTPSTKKLVKYIAAACFLPIAFYSVWIPVKTDVLESGMISLKDFNPFQQNVKSTYVSQKFETGFEETPKQQSFEEQTANLPQDVSIYSMEIDDEVYFVKIREKNSEQETNVEENFTSDSETVEKIELKTKTISKGNIQIIVGSFSNQNNAESLVNELKSKNYDAYSFQENNGLIRVSAGKAQNAQEAKSLVNHLAENQISAWILK
ncbi:MAG: SPOR domain-containing protein [Bacteroidota bacterium]